VTEIPEHLLKRSRERRAAIGGGGDDAGSGDTAPAVPATTAAAAPAATSSDPAERSAAPVPAVPDPPRPDIPVVAAYKARRKIPFWAMTALTLMPLWAFMYAKAVTTQERETTGPLAEGAVVYGNCASCHGGAGQGVAGLGYPFVDGEVLKTFPNIEDQIRFVYWGSADYQLAGVEIYGDPNREGGPHITGARGPMPAHGPDAAGALTDAELLGVVCHERFVLGGAENDAAYDAEFDKWCSPDSELFAAVAGGESLLTLDQVDDTVIPIGEPAAGQSGRE
jgi:hypothetical protein